jgi:SsrA-binding protein
MNKPSSPPARKASEAPRVIAENRRARFDYFIEERLDAGLVLEGWEVKSLRAGKAQITESHVYVRNGEAFITGAHINPLTTTSTHVIADPTRTRKLLLNKSEIAHLIGAVERKAKLQIGLAKGKKQHDKRATEKDRDWQRDKARLLRRG